MNPEQPSKDKLLDRFADESGVAIVIVDETDREVSASNNNSICAALYYSPEFAPHCAQFCGKAFEWTADAGKSVDYICHAGLACRTVPVRSGDKQFVAIVGRTFVKAENYRKAAERAINGDWKHFPPSEFFGNVLLSGSSRNIENAVQKLESRRCEGGQLEVAGPSLPESQSGDPASTNGPRPAPVLPPAKEIAKLVEKFNAEVPPAPPASPASISTLRSEAAEWRSLFSSLTGMDYTAACGVILDFVADRYGFESAIWLERRSGLLEPRCSRGGLKDLPVTIGIAADDPRMVEAANRDEPVAFRERRRFDDRGRRLNIFPVLVSGELRSALALEGMIRDGEQRRLISRFCRRVGPQIEILRLRNEVSERDWLAKAVRKFNESLKQIDTEDFWTHVTQISAELLQAERASLLVRGDKTDVLRAKAAVGSSVDLFAELTVGDRVARLVLDEGKPVIVSDIGRVPIKAAPADWHYRTSSFISYPISIGERRIAVMNFTDKAGGESFTDRDLELLQAIAPQIAVAIDRTALKDKAGEFEQLSVTDPLTGLSNRRYIERRLDEEIERSKRHRFPMSLMMLDVDEFKSYNDSFGHPAGDIALRIVSEVLKDTLRSADVAARYGGEEFAILLPQTTATEAAAIAERIRMRIERAEFPKRRVTISIGIASSSPDLHSPQDIIAAADHALYEAKNHGRNNVQVYDSLGKPFNENIH